jgi:dipeptide/tripeptide permease
MTSSGIVLMPFNPIRYSVILGLGLSLYITGCVFNEVVIDKHNLSIQQSIRLVLLSLTLAIGIGMISGGISHFKESPSYVSYLIPLGIIISFISFTLKNNFELTKKQKLIAFIVVILFAIVVFIGLSFAATMMMDMASGGDIFNKTH